LRGRGRQICLCDFKASQSEFQDSQGYIERSYLKKTKAKNKQTTKRKQEEEEAAAAAASLSTGLILKEIIGIHTGSLLLV
jgi:F0F1-type ATP synthase assembly protein I